MSNKISLLKEMLKEEARLHTSLYGGVSFYYFPLVLFLLSLFVSGVFMFIIDEINTEFYVMVSFMLFFLMGMMNGAFGIYAKDYLERRFGDIGRLFSNLTILPVSIQKIFFTTILKDVLFYLIWFVIPLYLGYAVIYIALESSLLHVLNQFISLLFVFMYGVLFAFLLSVLYEKYRKLFFSLMILVLVISLYVILTNFEIINYIIPYLYYMDPSLYYFGVMIVGLLMISGLISLLLGREFNTRVSEGKVEVESSNLFNKYKLDVFLLKDYLDLKRTGGLFGKPFFNVLVPALILLFIFTNTLYFSVGDKDLLLFAILLGALAVSLFSSLLSSDAYAYYKFLPTGIDRFIKSKIKITLLLGSFYGILLLLLFALYTDSLNLLVHSYLIYLIFMLYNLGITFYLAGLNPQEYLLNSKVFLIYSGLLLPMLFAGMFTVIFVDNLFVYLALLPIFALISYKFLEKGFKKWERAEEVK